MSSVFGALTPIFAMIVGGWLIRRTRFVTDAFWPQAEKLIYFVFFPSLIVISIGTADLDFGRLAGMAGAMAAAVWSVGLGLILLGRRGLPSRLGLDEPAYSSIAQGMIRPNSYVGLAVAAGLYGPEGVTLAAVGIAVVIPSVNVMAVVLLLRHGRPDGTVPAQGPAALARGVATNPLIVSVALGVALNLSGIALPGVVLGTLEILGRVSLPLGLLAVGAGLDFGATRRAGLSVAGTTAAKLAAIPALTAGLCLAFGVGGLPAAVAVLYNGLPTSASSYVLARQMGGDATLMAGIITATTLAAFVTLPAGALAAELIWPGVLGGG